MPVREKNSCRDRASSRSEPSMVEVTMVVCDREIQAHVHQADPERRNAERGGEQTNLATKAPDLVCGILTRLRTDSVTAILALAAGECRVELRPARDRA
jgi:hypothetical protein